MWACVGPFFHTRRNFHSYLSYFFLFFAEHLQRNSLRKLREIRKIYGEIEIRFWLHESRPWPFPSFLTRFCSKVASVETRFEEVRNGRRRYLGRKGISPPEVTISDRERFRRSAVRIHHRVDPSSCRTGLTGNHFCRWLLLENTDWKQGFVPFHWRNSAVWIFPSFFPFLSFFFLFHCTFSPSFSARAGGTWSDRTVVGVRNCSIWTARYETFNHRFNLRSIIKI